MAAAWIESHQSLRDHPKTKRLARLLGLPEPHVVGLVHYLWYFALDYAPEGDLSTFDAADIADALRWEGDPGALITALVDCGPGDSSGFLQHRDGRLVIHDWHTYAGRLIEARRRNAERMREARAPSEKKDAQGDDVNETCDARAGHVQDTCEATRPDQTDQPLPTDQTDQGKDRSFSAAGEGSVVERAVSALTTSPRWKLSGIQTRQLVAELAERYPSVDLPREVRSFLSFSADQREPIKNPRRALEGFMKKAKPAGQRAAPDCIPEWEPQIGALAGNLGNAWDMEDALARSTVGDDS